MGVLLTEAGIVCKIWSSMLGTTIVGNMSILGGSSKSSRLSFVLVSSTELLTRFLKNKFDLILITNFPLETLIESYFVPKIHLGLQVLFTRLISGI